MKATVSHNVNIFKYLAIARKTILKAISTGQPLGYQGIIPIQMGTETLEAFMRPEKSIILFRKVIA